MRIDTNEIKVFDDDGNLRKIVRFYNDGNVRQRIHFDDSGDITHTDNYPQSPEGLEPVIII